MDLQQRLLGSALSTWPMYRSHSTQYNSYLHCCVCVRRSFSWLFHFGVARTQMEHVLLCIFIFKLTGFAQRGRERSELYTDIQARGETIHILHSLFFMQIVCIHIQIFMRTNPFYLLCEQYFISIYARDAATLALLLACSTQNFTTLVILFTVFFLFLSSSCSGRRCDATAKIYLIVFGFEKDSWKPMLERAQYTLCN